MTWARDKKIIMKKGILILVALAVGVTVNAQITKKVPQIPVNPELEVEGSFSMIMVPDPQSYTKFEATQPLFELQTAWIAQSIKPLNIKAALFTGDMVEQNNQLTAGDPHHEGANGDQTSRQQWEAVSRALTHLDNRIPYIIAQGNHDVDLVTANSRASKMPEYIYSERNSEILNHLAATGTNYKGENTMENSAFEFHDSNWGDMLIISFEFAPRDETLEWARKLIESDKYKKYRVIILTHSFLSDNDERVRTEGYKLSPRNWPQAVWEKLVYPSKNISMVLCGHTGRAPQIAKDGSASDVSKIDYDCCSAFRVDKAQDGHEVVQMMFNAQMADGSWFGNGGDCWLRILEFRPDGETIGVRTFSPLFALSRITCSQAWRTAEYDRFEFKMKHIK